MPFAILTPFLLMPAAAWLGRQDARVARLSAIVPALLAAYFANLMQTVASTGPLTASLPWASQLGLSLSFYADGLSLLFALIISAIGSLILLFSSSYFQDDPRGGRFQSTLFAFMGAMLGVALADSLFVLFVFWELTGFTSFLLIGFDHEKKEARDSAIQAVVVTGTGGMGLLAAAALIEQASGSSYLSALLATGGVQSAPQYPWIAALLLAAAFTKSAQAPFHFWLPGAMTAPTPVSAYLHSATMVKAGVYLVARMTPIAGGTELWTGLVAGVGAVTMAIGAWRAMGETDLKRVLAFTTVSALGVLMMLLGVGTPAAITAALVYLCAHACYKGALFLIAGTLEHETGTRDVTHLGGLAAQMPHTARAGALAAASMLGIPLFLGFVGKELMYDALAHNDASWSLALLAAAVLASAWMGAAGAVAGVSPFTGPKGKASPHHAVPLAMAIPPLALGAVGLLAGVWPPLLDTPVSLAAASITRTAPNVHLALWHGFSWVLALSLATLALAGYLYQQRLRVRRLTQGLQGPDFAQIYTGSIRLLGHVSSLLLPSLQAASLRFYVRVMVITSGVLVAAVLAVGGLPPIPAIGKVEPSEIAAILMILFGAISAARTRSTIQAVLSLGITGYGVALTFLFFGAPDLAMTQFSVETLTAIIFVLVFYRFPNFGPLTPLHVRLGDVAVAALVGISVSGILLFATLSPTPNRLAGFFAQAAVPLAYGHNIVNVILVDFRALDTLGEITVLATAAIGVRAVFRLGRPGT